MWCYWILQSTGCCFFPFCFLTIVSLKRIPFFFPCSSPRLFFRSMHACRSCVPSAGRFLRQRAVSCRPRHDAPSLSLSRARGGGGSADCRRGVRGALGGSDGPVSRGEAGVLLSVVAAGQCVPGWTPVPPREGVDLIWYECLA